MLGIMNYTASAPMVLLSVLHRTRSEAVPVAHANPNKSMYHFLASTAARAQVHDDIERIGAGSCGTARSRRLHLYDEKYIQTSKIFNPYPCTSKQYLS